MISAGKSKLIAPWFLVIGGVVVLQYHAFQFWSVQAGVEIGWVWSLLIEVAGLWLWYQPDTSARFLGGVMAVILLTAPLHLLVSDALLKVELATAAKQSASKQEIFLRKSIEIHNTTIADFRANSKKKGKSGWAAEIEKVQIRLDAEKKALFTLLATPAHKSAQAVQQHVQSVTSLILTVFLQCSALVAIQLANIKAMLFLSRTMHAQQDVHDNMQANAVTSEVKDIAELRQLCQTHLDLNEMTASSFAESCGVSRHQVSFLLNYEPGRRKPTKDSIDVLKGVLI